MAESAINFVLDKLANFVLDNTKLIYNSVSGVETLKSELDQLKGFLRDASNKPNQSEGVKELVKRIRMASYEAEDIIDTYLTESALYESKGTAGKVFSATPRMLDLREIAVTTNDLSSRVKAIYQDRQSGFEAIERQDSTSVVASMTRRSAAPVVEEDNVVGFDKYAADLIRRINEGPDNLQVITVLGMGGLGKTTLVNKVWKDQNVLHEFGALCWVFVSKVYEPKALYLTILRKVLKELPRNVNTTLSEQELVEEMKKALMWKYLIVLDDVWDPNDWIKLKAAFPNHKNGSRIIITSRSEDVGNRANLEGKLKLDFLSPEDSRMLLELKVFGCLGKCPQDLKSAASVVAEKCGGLPLALVLMAGVLQNNINRTDWEKSAKGFKTFVAGKSDECLDILALSYHNLPYHMRDCFLYFGVFKRGDEISARTLIWLWIAEGLIRPDERLELEETADTYLDELARRNLVIVVRQSSTGQIKTCRVHDMLLDLCEKEAAKESFFHKVAAVKDRSSGGGGAVDYHHRRICIDSDIRDFIRPKLSCELAHSFLCFSKEDPRIEKKEGQIIPLAFKKARVLHAQPITFATYPVKLKNQILLRYVAISGDFPNLPETLSESVNLQTLIFETKSPSQAITVLADIFKLSKLRHFRTNVAATLFIPQTTTTSKRKDCRRSNLQTLSLITPESCTEEVLERTPYLKKLGICGKLAFLLEDNGGSRFNALITLKQLERLKLLTHIQGRAPSEGKLSSLPLSKCFPKTLRKVTISGTMLPWEEMSVLGELSKLEVLKARTKAFQGDTWNVTGFPSLKVLEIADTDLIYWGDATAANAFPLLETIVLDHCQSLHSFPASFGDAQSNVDTLKLKHCQSAVTNAKNIKSQREKCGGKPLKLDIVPAPKP